MIYPGHSYEECDENGGNCKYISSEGYDDRGGSNTLGISDLIEYAMGKSGFKTVSLNDEGHKDLYERLDLKSNDQIKNVGMISYSGGGTTSFPVLVHMEVNLTAVQIKNLAGTRVLNIKLPQGVKTLDGQGLIRIMNQIRMELE